MVHTSEKMVRISKVKNPICVACGRQFIDPYDSNKGYSDEVKRQCLNTYVNGMGLRGIERVTGVHHTTVIRWVKQVGQLRSRCLSPRDRPGSW